jgi:type II secretory pathway pseudopilin PulG
VSGRRGITLLEVVIASGVLATIMALALGVMSSMTEHVADASVTSDLASRGRNAAVLVQRELRVATRSSLVTDAPDAQSGLFTRVHFRQVVGFDTTAKSVVVAPATGTAHDIRFVLDAGETSDGADQDGDGLVDEGRLVLYHAGAPVADVARDVRASSLVFRIEPSAGATPTAGDTHLYVSFELQQKGRKAGVIETHVEAFQVGLRN